MPRLRRYGGTRVSGRPSSMISPAVADSKPAIIMRVVVLPEPLGPSSVRNSPGATVRETPSTAITGPNAFDTSTRSSAAPVCIALLVIVETESRVPLAQHGLTDAVVIAAILPDPPRPVKAQGPCQ